MKNDNIDIYKQKECSAEFIWEKIHPKMLY